MVDETVKTRKSVKQKYQSSKSDVAQLHTQLKKSYKPVPETFQNLLSTIKMDMTIKKEPVGFNLKHQKGPMLMSTANICLHYP